MRLPDKVYDVLKWVCLICLPALAALYTVLAKIWGWPFESEVPATINAIAALDDAVSPIILNTGELKKSERSIVLLPDHQL